MPLNFPFHISAIFILHWQLSRCMEHYHFPFHSFQCFVKPRSHGGKTLSRLTYDCVCNLHFKHLGLLDSSFLAETRIVTNSQTFALPSALAHFLLRRPWKAEPLTLNNMAAPPTERQGQMGLQQGVPAQAAYLCSLQCNWYLLPCASITKTGREWRQVVTQALIS
jgi:hypothetical protein